MNLSVIINEINKDLDDTFDLTDLLGWVNRALDICSEVYDYRKAIILLLEEGVSDYDLPSDLISLEHVVGSAGEYNEVALTNFTEPGYKRWGNLIGLQNMSEHSLTFYYKARLPHLENPDDIPVLPLHFHDLLVLYAVARGKAQDEEEDLQATNMAEFNSRLRDLQLYSEKQNRMKNKGVRVKTVW